MPLPVETITASVTAAATAAATATTTPVEVPPVADLVQVVISSENVEAVKAFLAEKVAEKEA